MAENLITERGRALLLASAILDRPNADPDDDLAVLSRQLIRAEEEAEALRKFRDGLVALLRQVNPYASW